jgi:hypothetical protein
MNKNTKGIIAVGIVLGVVGLAYWGITKFGKTDTDTSTDTENKDELDLLRQNLGTTAGIKTDVEIVKFNGGKNVIDFFKNGRFFLYSLDNKGTKKYINKGNWSNGGLNLKTDDGKEVSSTSVYKNLQDLIK